MTSQWLDAHNLLLAIATIAGQELPPALWWTLSVWTFAVGAAIGSFLNVVVYRMPAGLSIVHPGSFCPSCKHPIRWWHNLPIVGWLMLGGRCYDCGARISPRYPVVEAITAVIFALLCQVEVFSGGVNLPHLHTIGEPSLATLWAIYCYHLLLCCTLLCIALIEFDAQRVPAALWLPVLAVGLVVPLVAPELHQVPFTFPMSQPITWHPSVIAALNGLCGVALATALGWPAARLARMPPSTAAAMRAGLLLVGAFLGWQAVLVLANATMIVYLVVAALDRFVSPVFRRVPWSGILGMLTLALVCFWKPLALLVAALN